VERKNWEMEEGVAAMAEVVETVARDQTRYDADME
jgi:hypothetical protein